MAIEQIDLELIEDNPYQARLTYHKKDIDELAHSIKTHGLLQVPPGRRKDGNIELGFGHLRKRAFVKLAKKEPEKWGKMPVDIRDLTDDQMAMFALEENLKRRDISPLETARAVDKYLVSFPGKTEVELAESLNMAKGTVSNMRRVLRLPEKILQKIDEGIISFHQGRDLLIFERFENAENLMRSALDGLKIGNKAYGELNTVEGLQKSIHGVISGQCRPLDKEWEGYRWDLLFDTRAAGCLECDKMIRTHPTKSATAHYCTDAECWQAKHEEHRGKAAAEAKAKMEAEVLQRAAAEFSEKSVPTQVGKRIAEVDAELMDKVNASYSGDRIAEGTPLRRSFKFEDKQFICTGGDSEKWECYQLVPIEEYEGEPRTYKVPQGREYDEYYQSLRNTPEGFYHGMLVNKGTKVLIGPPTIFRLQTKEKLPGEVKAPEQKRKAIPVVADAGGVVMPVPCESCATAETCDRTYFHVDTDGGGQLVCEQKVEAVKETLPAAPGIPEDILALAREKAGTRAEVLDLNDICTGERYWRQVKQGYAILDDLRLIDDPAECLESCTHGFHYAFDSKASDQRVFQVCSDTKCLAKKKAAFTRAQNAAGQARKKAETKAVKQAIDLVGQVISDGKQLLDEEGKFANTLVVPRATLKLILLAQIKGSHLRSHSYDYYNKTKPPEKWLWDKVSAGTKESDRTVEKLFKAIDKLTDEDLSSLVIEVMFYYLMDHGDVGTYQIKTEVPLGWLGVEIELPQETTVMEEEASDGES